MVSCLQSLRCYPLEVELACAWSLVYQGNHPNDTLVLLAFLTCQQRVAACWHLWRHAGMSASRSIRRALEACQKQPLNVQHEHCTAHLSRALDRVQDLAGQSKQVADIHRPEKGDLTDTVKLRPGASKHECCRKSQLKCPPAQTQSECTCSQTPMTGVTSQLHL